jgi:hypothetical protein
MDRHADQFAVGEAYGPCPPLPGSECVLGGTVKEREGLLRSDGQRQRITEYRTVAYTGFPQRSCILAMFFALRSLRVTSSSQVGGSKFGDRVWVGVYIGPVNIARA